MTRNQWLALKLDGHLKKIKDTVEIQTMLIKELIMSIKIFNKGHGGGRKKK